MNQTGRVVGVSVLVSLGVGILLLTCQVGSWESLRWTFTTANGALNFLVILVIVVVPASLPMTLLGGFVAARALARERARRPFRYWVGRGSACGALLGALGSVVWFGAITLQHMTGLMPFLLSMGALGAGLGSLVGAVVGAYCWRASCAPVRVADQA